MKENIDKENESDSLMANAEDQGEKMAVESGGEGFIINKGTVSQFLDDSQNMNQDIGFGWINQVDVNQSGTIGPSGNIMNPPQSEKKPEFNIVIEKEETQADEVNIPPRIERVVYKARRTGVPDAQDITIEIPKMPEFNENLEIDKKAELKVNDLLKKKRARKKNMKESIYLAAQIPKKTKPVSDIAKLANEMIKKGIKNLSGVQGFLEEKNLKVKKSEELLYETIVKSKVFNGKVSLTDTFANRPMYFYFYTNKFPVRSFSNDSLFLNAMAGIMAERSRNETIKKNVTNV